MDSQSLKNLSTRLGYTRLSSRLIQQVDHSASKFNFGGLIEYLKEQEPIFDVFEFILKKIGLFERGNLNTIDYELVENIIISHKIPKSFDGFIIMQLSDLHIDGIPDEGEKLRQIISQIECDICVITGDFRLRTFGDYQKSIKLMKPLVESIKYKDCIIGILGNHDFIEMVPGLESLGIKMLLNEGINIKREDSISVFGLDDTHLYKTHDFGRILDNFSNEKFKILLAHSPEVVRIASSLDFDLYLCGHTHGGQVCLAGGIPLISSSSTGRKFISGFWKHNNMQGYTSRGTGSSGTPVRFNCPPEITIHRLICPN